MRSIQLLSAISLLIPFSTHAETPAEGGFTFTYENDVFLNTDRSYTNGVRFSWISAEEDLPGFIRPLADNLLSPISDSVPFFPKDGKRRVSYAFGQSMFTPQDITQRTLITNDRPYAGWLYGSLGYISDNGEHMDALELSIGVVGPASLAEQTQSYVHREITGSPIPEGWDNQLDNEPGFVLRYEHKWRNLYEFSPFGLGVDFTPHMGASLGNVFTHAALGGTARLGYDLPADYGPPRVRPSISGSDFFIPTRHVGWYLFAGFEGRAVARNIFLDGNTFGDSHDVDKKHFTGDFQAGIAFTYKDVRLAYTTVYRTKEYDVQHGGDRFGALTLSVKF
ncbi:MAG: lipid A deacylase LpxR family protein [Hyphomicrobiales bacterium]|nr:lipid A deacylase LpxR family protein [Hyphomicrobiales bacterium]